jgi:hypothetical protein
VHVDLVASEIRSPISISGAPPTTIKNGDTIRFNAVFGTPKPPDLPAAEIYTYGQGNDHLGIGPNFNCLYLYYDAAGVLTAKMVKEPSLGPGVRACLDGVNPVTTPGKKLSVIRTSNGTSGDYPPVARWDWDVVNKQQYIGIQCGDGWCEVGAPGARPFTPSPGHWASTGAPPGVTRVLTIKGWYDEQFLALPNGGGGAEPSAVKATIIPDPNLVSRHRSDYTGSWVRVAHVALLVGNGGTAAAAYYKQKFNFDAVPVNPSLTGMNKMWMCYGTRDECHVPAPPPPAPPAPAAGCGPDKKLPFIWFIRRWWVKVESASGDKVMYRCVTRRDHLAATSAMQIVSPATARWRWIANDESTWNYCEVAGCCESNGDGKGW